MIEKLKDTKIAKLVSETAMLIEMWNNYWMPPHANVVAMVMMILLQCCD